MIITAPDSAAIVASLREQLVKLGLLRNGESRNGHTAKALEQCVLIKKDDLNLLLSRTPKYRGLISDRERYEQALNDIDDRYRDKV